MDRKNVVIINGVNYDIVRVNSRKRQYECKIPGTNHIITGDTIYKVKNQIHQYAYVNRKPILTNEELARRINAEFDTPPAVRIAKMLIELGYDEDMMCKQLMTGRNATTYSAINYIPEPHTLAIRNAYRDIKRGVIK